MDRPSFSRPVCLEWFAPNLKDARETEVANIGIDLYLCSGCRLCAENCHEQALTLAAGNVRIDSALCDGCAQCVAICPSRALSWEGFTPTAFDRTLLPAPNQLLELFRERHSIRAFKAAPIDRALLADIAACGAFAPTHNQVFKVIVIDDPNLIAVLSAAVLAINNRIYRLVYHNPLLALGLVRSLISRLGYADEFRKARPKLERAAQRGSVFASTPAAILIIVGEKNAPLAEASAQYALANMMYYAQIQRVGACLWGNAPIFLDKHQSIRRQLGLTIRERIYGALCLGYPRIKFSNKVNGKTLPIQWNARRNPTPPSAAGAGRPAERVSMSDGAQSAAHTSKGSP